MTMLTPEEAHGTAVRASRAQPAESLKRRSAAVFGCPLTLHMVPLSRVPASVQSGCLRGGQVYDLLAVQALRLPLGPEARCRAVFVSLQRLQRPWTLQRIPQANGRCSRSGPGAVRSQQQLCSGLRLHRGDAQVGLWAQRFRSGLYGCSMRSLSRTKDSFYLYV